MMNFVAPQLFIKWFVCNALLHRPRQCKYLGGFSISFNSDNRILRYQRKYIINKHKCSGPRQRDMPLHRYYSSSLSPYGACSTSHYHHHCASAQRTCFWTIILLCIDVILSPYFMISEIQENALMMMNFFAPQLFTKWFVCNAILHRPRQYKYLGYFWISFNSDNRILRYQTKCDSAVGLRTFTGMYNQR